MVVVQHKYRQSIGAFTWICIFSYSIFFVGMLALFMYNTHEESMLCWSASGIGILFIIKIS